MMGQGFTDMILTKEIRFWAIWAIVCFLIGFFVCDIIYYIKYFIQWILGVI